MLRHPIAIVEIDDEPEIIVVDEPSPIRRNESIPVGPGETLRTKPRSQTPPTDAGVEAKPEVIVKPEPQELKSFMRPINKTLPARLRERKGNPEEVETDEWDQALAKRKLRATHGKVGARKPSTVAKMPEEAGQRDQIVWIDLRMESLQIGQNADNVQSSHRKFPRWML